MEIGFVTAVAHDLPRIVETYNASIPSRLATADLAPVTVDSRRAWFDAHRPDQLPLWLVTCNGNYAGWMSLNAFYGRPAYAATAEVSIYLDDKYQNKGIGKACLQHAIDRAPGLGLRTLLGFIFSHNTTSLALFTRFGFSRWGVLPEVANMDGIYRDLVIVGKTLPPQASDGASSL